MKVGDLMQQPAYPIIIGVDTETSGTRPWKHGIIQIGAKVINRDGKELAVFNQYCNPGDVVYEQEALDINHITLEQIQTFRPIKEVLVEFVDFMNKYVDNFKQRAVVVGNNFAFDTYFFQYAFDKHIPEMEKKTKWMFRRTDDLKGVSRTVLPHLEHQNQAKLGDLMYVPNLKAHDAMGDVDQMLGIYMKLMEKNDARIALEYNYNLQKSRQLVKSKLSEG